MTTDAHPAPSDSEPVSFPRLYARTGRFTLGEPRTITVTADGATVLFVRTASGTDRTGALWAFDVADATERLLADPAALLGDDGEDLPAAERARRERSRESGAGIVGYSVDNAGSTAVFALSGALWSCVVGTGACTRLAAADSVIDPRIDPTGRRIAYASGRELRILELATGADRILVGPDPNDPAQAEVVWGQAEFVAAEEMDRHRGFWWAPDGESLLVERYDDAPVGIWYIADPAHPDREPAAHRYPAAGTANADVSLWHVTVAGKRRQVPCTDVGFPYLARVSWTSAGAVLQVLSRDQRRSRILRPGLDRADRYLADPTLSPACEVLAEIQDRAWVDLVIGLPALTPDGRLLTDDAGYAGHAGAARDDDSDTHRLLLDGTPLTPAGMQLRAVLHVAADGVIAAVCTEPTEQRLVHIGYDGSILDLSTGPGVHTGAAGGDTVVIASSFLDSTSAQLTVCRLLRDDDTVAPPSDNAPTGGNTSFKGVRVVGALVNRVLPAPLTPRVAMLTVGERKLRAALVLPQEHTRGSQRLPVIMAPYGGPHAQLVRAAGRLFLQAQWLADQGFAVVVADGRGSPGRGPAWEREVAGEFAAVTLADQVDALAGVAAQYPDDLDTDRVGIMGWSYGGYLSALAVLDRPDVFHAAVAGAPVTDWRLYDTCYTERYLGDPATELEAYERNSLIARADRLTRPLLLIHGLADDNVVVAHTLRLSAALLAAGRTHEVLPLTGITHMASSETVAENLLKAQVEFFRRALAR